MSDLVVHYTFEPSTISGTTISNASYGAKTINGTLSASVTTSTSIYKVGSQSVGFNGSSVISIPTVASTSESWQNATLSFWVYRTTTQTTSRIISQLRTGSQYFNVQIQGNSNNLIFNTSALSYTHTSANVFPNNWHHIVWVISPNSWRIYVNNVKVEIATTVVLSSAIAQGYIGADTTVVGLIGNIDDWRLYKIALSDDQVYEIFDRASYIHYYRFESEDVTTSAPYTIANLASGIPVNNATINSASSPNNFTSSAFKIDTSVYKSGTSSLYTNGNLSNYITLPTISNIDPSGITLSVWYNPSAGSSRRPIFIMNSGSYYWQVLYNQQSTRLLFSLSTYPSAVTVNNGFFTTPDIASGTFSVISSPYTSITGWSISSNTYGIYIVERSSAFGTPTLPAGVTQVLAIQSYLSPSTATVSQTFTLQVGTYNVSFYSAGRTGGYYSTSQTIAVSLGGLSVVTARSVSSSSWLQSINTVSITSAGSYTLTFTVSSTVTADTTLYITGVEITPQITELGQLIAATEYANGLNIGSDKSAPYIRYGGSISAGTWQHLIWIITPNYWAITINGATTKMYPESRITSATMNSVLVAMPTSGLVSLSTTPLIANAFVGYYDDFRVYNRVLTDAEVSRLYTLRCLRTNYYDKYGNDFIRLFNSGSSGISLGYETETNDNISSIFGLYSPSLTNTRLTVSYVLYDSITLHLVDSISGSTVKPITRVLPGQIVSSTVITTNPYVMSVDASNNTVVLNKASGGSAQSVSGQSVAGYYYVTNGIAVLMVNPNTSQSFTGTAPAVGNMLYHTNIPIGTYIKAIYEPNLEDFTIPVATNESFSTPAIASNSSSSISSPYSSITGWTINGTPEIFIMNRTSPFGVAAPPDNVTQWIGVKTTTSGQTFTITQSIVFPTTGQFTLSFNVVAGTSSSTTNTISASISGYSTGAFYPGTSSWITRQLTGIFVAAGTYTLTFTITTGQSITSYMYFTNVLFSSNTTFGSNTVTSSLPTSFLLSNTNINIPVTTTETMKWYTPYTNVNFYNVPDITENSGYNLFSGTTGFDDFVYKFSNLKNTSVPYIATGTHSVTNHSNGFYTIQFTGYGTIQFIEDASTNIQLLVVGSGGGGGSSQVDSKSGIYYGGGGGGGGQVRYFSSYRINKQAIYTVDVGIGGEVGVNATGGRGAPCLFGNIVSLGGAGGGISTTSTGGAGGSGGGSGGGAGTSSVNAGSNGGNGSSITFGASSATFYAGGGAGGRWGTAAGTNGTGGSGGGGSLGGAGTNGLGGGGAGANGSLSNTAGGAGGTGVVLIYVSAAPDAPKGLVSTTKTNTTIAISFIAPVRLVTTYTLRAQPTSGSIITATFSSGTTYTITGLTQGTTYSISLTASNSAGTSPSSNIISVTTLKTSSDAPTIGLLGATNDTLEITFGSSEQEMTSISTYAVNVESPFTTTQAYKTSNYLAKIPGLSRNTFYRVYATGTAAYGNTPTSISTFKTRNVPDPVSSLSVVSRTSSNIVFSFNRPTTNDDGVSPILYYTFNEGTYNSTNVGNLSSGQVVYDASLSTGTINTTRYKYGNSSLYNTSTNGFPFRMNTTLDLGSYSYLTICIWLYPTAYFVGASAVNLMWLYSFNNSNIQTGAYNGMLYSVRFQSNGTQRIICGNQNYYTNVVIPLNNWSHLTYVQQFSNTNASTNTLQVYLNGTLQQTITNMNTYNANMLAVTNYIGSQTDGTAYSNGWIDDFRIYAQALTQSQIQKVYNNNLPLNQALTQYNLYSGSLYNYNKTSMIGFYRFFPYNIVGQNIIYNYAYSSLVLDASLVNLPPLTKVRNTYELTLSSIYRQHIQLPSITIGTNGFTFACWFRANNTGNWSRLLDLGTFNTLATTIYLAVSSNVLKYGFYNSGGGNMTTDITIHSTNVNTNTYYHLVFIIGARSGTTCTVSTYLNGSLIYSASNISYPEIITRSSCFIGRSNYTADPYLNGGVYDVYMWLRAISGTEALYLYNNPSTNAFQVISDVSSSTITQTVSGLQNGENYVVTVSSANSDGEAFTTPLLGVTLLPPSTPTNFSVGSVTDVSAVFQFTSPSEPVTYYNLQLYTNSITTVGFSLNTTNTFSSSLPNTDIRFGYNTISVTRPGANRILLVTYGYDFGISGFVRYFIVNGTLTSFDIISVTVTSVSTYVLSNGVISDDGTRIVAVVYSDSNAFRIFYGDATAITANTSNSITLNQIGDNASGFYYDSISLTTDGNTMVTTRVDQNTNLGVICFSQWDGTNYGPLIPTLDTTSRLLSSVAVSGDGSRIVYACNNDAIFWAVWNGYNYGTATQIPYSISSSNNDPKKVVFLGGNTNVIAVKSDSNSALKYAVFNGINYTSFENAMNQPVPSGTRMFISDTSFNIYSVTADPEIFSSTYSFTTGTILGLDASLNASPYTVNTLFKGTTYTASLKAGNADGESATTSVGFTTLREPDAPTNLTFSGQGNSQITLSFTPPSGTVTRYDVSAISQTQTVSASFTPPQTSYQLTGLIGATTYYILLSAANTYGRSFPITGSSATLLIPDAVTNLTATSLTDTSIRLNYTPPAQTVTNYSLTYSNVNPDTFTNLSFGNSTTVFNGAASNAVELTITAPGSTRLAVFATFSGLRYSRILNDVWNTLSTPTITYDISPVATRTTACDILSDASRLVCSFGNWTTNDNLFYFTNATNLYNGTSTSLSFTRILETTQRAYSAMALTSDGSRLVAAAYGGRVFFSTWNGTNYSAFTQTFESTSRNYNGICVSNDGNKIAYCSDNTIFWSVWNGTNYMNGTQILGGNSNAQTRKVSFLGPDSDFLILSNTSGQSQYTTWNGTNYAALSNISSTALPQNVDGWGLFVDTNGNSANIYLAPFSNTNVYRSVLTFNKISNKTTVSVPGASTTYTITGLVKNTTYDISFVTINIYGSSPAATTTGSTRNTVDQVTFVSASTTNTTSLITFCAPIQTVSSYTTTIDASGLTYTKTYNTPSVSFVGLVPNRTYTYNVTAFGADSSSNVTSSFTTPIIPTAPGAPVLIAESPYAIDVSFGLVEQSLPAIYFNGSTEIEASSVSDANINTGTIECWFRTNSNVAAAAALVIKPAAYGLYLVNNALSVYDWSASTWRHTGYILNNNVWYHVAFTFQNGITNGSNVYLNGDLISTFTYTSSSQAYKLCVGSAGGWQYFTGYISEVRIWNTVRTASQIAMFSNKKLPASETGLIGYFPMVESAGSIIYNAVKTGGIPNMTLSNTAQWTTDTIDIIDLSNSSYTLTATPTSGTTVTASLTRPYGSVGGLVPNTTYTVTVRTVNASGTSSASNGLSVLTDASTAYINSEIYIASSIAVLYTSSLFTSNTLTVTGQTPTYRNGTYTVSESSFDTSTRAGYRAFNLNSASNTNFWATTPNQYNTSGVYIGSFTTSNIANSSNISGEWIQIQLPYRLLLKQIGLMERRDMDLDRLPYSFVVVGSNDGTNWNIVYQQTQPPAEYVYLSLNTISVTTAVTPYSYFRLIARTTKSGGTNNDQINIQQLNYNGDIYTPPTLITAPYPLLYDSSITNSTSISSTLYRSVNPTNGIYYYKLNGFAGDINVTRTLFSILASATNVLYSSNLFSGDTLTVSGQTPTYRNGTYITSASSVLNYTNNAVNDNVSFGAFRAFNLSTSTANTNAYWHSESNRYSTSSPFSYTGSVVTTNIASSSDISGEWIQIQLPYKIVLKSVGLMPRQSAFPYHRISMPGNMSIVGSNDGTNWNVIYTNSSLTSSSYSSSSATVTTFSITGATTPYSYIRLIATTTTGNSALNIEQVNYNGDIYTDDTNITTTTRVLNYASGTGIADASLVNNPQMGFLSEYYQLQLVSALSQYVQLPAFTIGNNGFSVSCWFRSNASANFARIFDFASGAEGVNDIFLAINSNDLCYRIAGTTIYYNLTSSNINANTHNHVAFILSAPSASTCTVTLYLNNVLKYTGSNITYPSVLSRTICSIGKSSYVSNATFNGGIFDFYTWNRPLSVNEVSSMYFSAVVSSSYRIYTLPLNTRSSSVITNRTGFVSSSVTSTISGLSYGQSYAVYATNTTVGESSPSNVLYLTIPGPAPTIALSSYTNTTVTITITPNLAYVTTFYTITVTNASTAVLTRQNVTTTTSTITGLTENTSYVISVVANTRTVPSTPSNILSVTTDTAPASPTGLAVTSFSNNLVMSFTRFTGTTTRVPATYFISGRSRISDVNSITFANSTTLASTAATDHFRMSISAPGATRLVLLVGLTQIQTYRILNGVWGSVNTITTSGVTVVDFISCALTADGQRAAIIHGTNQGNALVYFANTSALFSGSSTSLALTQTSNTTQRMYSCIALTKDGSRMVCGARSGSLFYATWSGTNYSTFTEIVTPKRVYTGVAFSGDSNYLVYSTQLMVYWRVWNGSTYTTERYAKMTESTNEVYNVSYVGDDNNLLIFSHAGGASYLYFDGNTYTGATQIPTTAIPTGTNRGLVVDTSNNIYISAQSSANIRGTSISSITYAAASTFTKTLTASRFVNTTNILMYYKLNGDDNFDQRLFNYGPTPLVSDASLANSPSFGTTSGYRELQLVSTSSHHVTLPSFTIGTSGLTVAFWFRANTSAQWSRFFELSTGSGANSIVVAMNSNSLNYAITNSGGSGSNIIIQSNINDNVYRHFVFVIGAQSGSTCNITGYVNGSAVYNGTNLAYPPIVARNINYIGRSSFSADPYYNGGIFDFFIWNRAITASEVTNLYSNPNGDFTTYTTFTGLSNYKTYDISINATNAYGTSVASNINYTMGASNGTLVANTIYRLYRFTSSGAITVPGARTVYFALIGGGGTGGNANATYWNYNATGGGASGLTTQSVSQSSTTTYYIDVGFGAESTGFDPALVVDGNQSRIYYPSTFASNITSSFGSGAPIRTSTTTAPGGSAGATSTVSIPSVTVSGTAGAGSIANTNPSNGITLSIGTTSYSICGGGGGAQNTSTGQNSFGAGFAATSSAGPSSATANTGSGGGGQRLWVNSTTIRGGGGRGGSGVVLVFYA